MATVRLKKGFDIHLLGTITDNAIVDAAKSNTVAVIPDDFHGVIPRMEKKEGEHVAAGEPLYHDKNYEAIKVVSPVSGTVKEVRRGERRHIDAIVTGLARPSPTTSWVMPSKCCCCPACG